MKQELWFGAMAIALAFVIVAGCASVGRAVEARVHAKLMPADKTAANTELALDRAQVDKLEANLDQLNALMLAYPKLKGDKVHAEITANIEWYHERISQITAILPTLPERPAAEAAGPTAAPAQ